MAAPEPVGLCIVGAGPAALAVLLRLLHASRDVCASPVAREDAARLLHSTVVIDASGGWLALWRRKLGSQVLHAEPRSTLHRLSLLLLPFRRASPICARRPLSTRTRLVSSTLPPALNDLFNREDNLASEEAVDLRYLCPRVIPSKRTRAAPGWAPTFGEVVVWMFVKVVRRPFIARACRR